MNKENKLPYALCAISLILVFFPPLNVHGNSMSPTAINNDWVLTTKLYTSIKRGDVVIVKKNGYFIKRVIGLPGETIEMRNGWIYISGKKYVEDNFAPKDRGTSDYIAKSNLEPVTLGDDEFFVLGDNRARSFDSREWIRSDIHIRENNITHVVLCCLGQPLSTMKLG